MPSSTAAAAGGQEGEQQPGVSFVELPAGVLSVAPGRFRLAAPGDLLGQLLVAEITFGRVSLHGPSMGPGRAQVKGEPDCRRPLPACPAGEAVRWLERPALPLCSTPAGLSGR